MDSLLSIEQSLDTLDEALAPLLEKDLYTTLSQLDLLQKAKLQVLLPYVVNDLVFSEYSVAQRDHQVHDCCVVYLKTRGINPKTHSVFGELVRRFFTTLKPIQ